MQTLTDNVLMLKVKSGDLDKLGLLYERHKKKLFGFFYNMGNNPSISEDLVQNVFVRILKYRNSFTGEGPFTAWMFSMARNVNYDHYKKVSHESVSRNVSPEQVDKGTGDYLNEAMDLQGDAHLLKKALGLLPAEKKEILLLSKYRELKFQEIGDILGCSEGAAKVRVHRALKDLKTIFLQLETR
ncbi:RNA polymerase sigma factor [Flagellimonas taeanensis]|uniref:RNA polymerase sigma factor n=1 Tax=Flavobacteriaceae TaxID=49546 RepID=UPI000E676F3C|nr:MULTISPECIES: RNA polymerase sigma factor [Allomuricauda]MDC6384071.1 RNA polymerase sigma factor [Muricauda sp. SK9]RIV48677.1 RNA polymerase sigma factor [Allomuricauda taeanensis]